MTYYSISNRAANGFIHCLGECSSRTDFHSQGFALSGEINDLFSDADISPNESFVNLFGQQYHFETNQSDLERLFKCARHRLLKLDSAAKLCHKNGNFLSPKPSSTSVDMLDIRRELREFYIFIRHLLKMERCSAENLWVLESLLPTIEEGLSVLQRELGWLTNLPSWAWNLSLSGREVQPETAGSQLFHAHLEMRWLHISVLWVIHQLPVEIPENHRSSRIYESVMHCIWDLMEIALTRFSKFKDDQIMSKSFYNCVCVKELWFLLKSLCDKAKGINGQSFWNFIDYALEAISQGNVDHTTNHVVWTSEIPTKLITHDSSLGSLFALKHLAELSLYDGKVCLERAVEDNYDSLKRILRNFSGSCTSIPSESQLRAVVYFVKILVTDIWAPKTDPVMMLWDYFSRSLDCAFQMSGASTAAYSVPCESPQDILHSVSSILEGKPYKGLSMNSYDMFLSLLGNCLDDNPSQWKQKMCGRFYSKLSLKKVLSLSEMGLFHLTQLFLTIGMKADIEDVRERFQSLFVFKHIEDKNNAMVLKAHLSFCFLYAQKNLSLKTILSPSIAFISECVEKEKFILPRSFVSSMKDLVSKNNDLMNHSIFVGKWINKYLHQQHPDSGRNMLCTLLEIMRSLELCLDTNGGVVEEEMECLVLALWENLLPYIIVKQMEGSHASLIIADLAISFTFLSVYNAGSSTFTQKVYSFEHVVAQFLMVDSTSLVNTSAISRYIYLFFAHNKAKAVLEDSEKLQQLFIKAWVRCCSVSDVKSEELKSVSRKLFELTSVIQNTTGSPTSALQEVGSSADPLCNLFKIFGEQMKKVSDSALYRNVVCSLLQPLERLSRLYKQYLFPGKPKEEAKTERNIGEELPRSVVMRGYYVLARAVADCGNVIYQRGMGNSLLPHIISTSLLPNKIYDLSFRLPSSLNDALRKCLLVFLQGLVKLDCSKDLCINRYVGNIVSAYLPRMVVEPGSSSTSLNPFVLIWDEPENMGTATVVLPIIFNTFLQVDKSTNLPNKHYVLCLQYLIDLANRNRTDDLLFSILIRSAVPCLLEVMGKVTDIGARTRCKEKTKIFLSEIFQADAYLSHSNLWTETPNEIAKLSEKYLMSNIDVLKRILLFLLKDFRFILKSFLPSLMKQIENEKLKGRNVSNQQNLCVFLQRALINGSPEIH